MVQGLYLLPQLPKNFHRLLLENLPWPTIHTLVPSTSFASLRVLRYKRVVNAKERANAEAESLKLVMQLQQEEVASARKRQEHQQRTSLSSGNVRTMTRAELAAEVKSLRDWLKQCKEGDARKPELDAALSLLIQVKLSGTSSSTLRTSFCVEGYVQTIC